MKRDRVVNRIECRTTCNIKKGQECNLTNSPWHHRSLIGDEAERSLWSDSYRSPTAERESIHSYPDTQPTGYQQYAPGFWTGMSG